MSKAPLPRPCGSCPYRKDVPSGVWAASEYAKLPLYDLPLVEQPAGVFGCHQANGHLCGGWVGCHDMEENLALRISILGGHLAGEEIDKTFDYVSPVPLFESGREAAEHGLRDIETPDDRARRLSDRLLKKLKDKGVTTE